MSIKENRRIIVKFTTSRGIGVGRHGRDLEEI